MSGESEARIRDLFTEAKERAPCIIFIDEIDAVAPKRENAQRQMEQRIVAQFLTSMDDLTLENTNNKPVLVIGATNRPDSIDPALRRPGRFDREICLGVPDDKSRARILAKLASKLRVAGDFDFNALARKSPGYVGADLEALTIEAGIRSLERIIQCLDAGGQMNSLEDGRPQVEAMDVDSVRELEGTLAAVGPPTDATEQNVTDASDLPVELSQVLQEQGGSLSAKLAHLTIRMEDFEEALKKVQPSSKREGFAAIPDVTFADIGALQKVRNKLRMAIVQPILFPERFAALGITTASGVLLWGPPGCGKTLLAKAVANESGANFISVKGPELLNKFLGESEKAVRQLFDRARTSSPCIIFFDELDALCPHRRGDESQSQATENVVNSLLVEMDGLDHRKQVFVIGATNRPDIIDPAILRPGRFDKLLYVELPTAEERVEILRSILRPVPLGADVDASSLGLSSRCEGFSGADLSALVREAAMFSYEETFASEALEMPRVFLRHFEAAFGEVFPSVNEEARRKYDQLQRRLRGRRSNLN